MRSIGEFRCESAYNLDNLSPHKHDLKRSTNVVRKFQLLKLLHQAIEY